MMKRKKADLKKTIMLTKLNTYGNKNRKNTIPKALPSAQEKRIKKQPIQSGEKGHYAKASRHRLEDNRTVSEPKNK